MLNLKNWKKVDDNYINKDNGWLEAYGRQDGIQVFFGKGGKVNFFMQSEDLSITELEEITKYAKEF